MSVLRFGPEATEDQLRRALVEAGRLAYEQGVMVATDGNLSVRLDAERVLITPSGLPKGHLEPADMLTLDLDGAVVRPAADPNLKPSSETPMHLEVYRRRADVRAVIHAHPTFALALMVAGRPFPTDVLAEALVTFGDVPVTDYAKPATHEDAEAIRDLIDDHDAILLRQHGSLTVGRDMETALVLLERLEHVAKVVVMAGVLGEVNRLASDEVQRLRDMRAQR